MPGTRDHPNSVKSPGVRFTNLKVLRTELGHKYILVEFLS